MLDIPRLIVVEAVTRGLAQALFDLARFRTQAIGLAAGEHAARPKLVDAALDAVDSRLHRAELAVIIIAIGIALRHRPILRLGRILGGCRGGGECQSRPGGGGNQKSIYA